jgi:hypothetical protein
VPMFDAHSDLSRIFVMIMSGLSRFA